jgi:hypothetical protein
MEPSPAVIPLHRRSYSRIVGSEESFSPVPKIWITSRFSKTFSDGPPMRAGNNFDGCWGTSSNRDDEIAANSGPTGVAG